jgi:tetratricopeptide (TPR) repeat protein
VLLLVTGFVLAVRKRAPHLFVGWFWFVVALVPVSQLVPIGTHAMADRFAYLPSIGIFVMLAWLVDLRGRKVWLVAGVSAAAAMVILCAAVTRRQVTYWADTRTLFERALAVEPVNWLVHNNLGVYLLRKGDAAAAADHFAAALRIRPDHENARRNLEWARWYLSLSGRR